MKLKDLKPFIFSIVTVRNFSEDSALLYQGFLQNAPEDVLNMNIRTMGAKGIFQFIVFVEEAEEACA